MINVITHWGIEMHSDAWMNLTSAYEVQNPYIIGGTATGFVPFDSSVHRVPEKHVCLLHPSETTETLISIEDYRHPADATYVFGPDDGRTGWHRNFPGADLVCIPVVNGMQFYSHIAAAITLHDRLVKSRQ